MSKLLCECNYVIVDNTDNLSYKAYFNRDQDNEGFDRRIDDIVQYIESVKNNTSKEWVGKYFGQDNDDIQTIDVVFSIITKYSVNYESLMYQCNNCGRLFVQKGKENKYISFNLENEDEKNLFNRLDKSSI